MHVPFVDLFAQHQELRPQIEAIFQKVLEQSAFVGGSMVTEFEQAYAAYCGTAHAVACANGTDALKLALMAVGVQSGDEVITAPHTFIATVEGMSLLGAFPAFVDIDPATYALSAEKLDEFLAENCQRDSDGRLRNKRTHRPVTTILPVHLYGLPADMNAIHALAQQYGLRVVEDACQAHGATYQTNGTVHKAGNLAEAAAFSFYPGKNLGAMGEAGAVTTNNPDMALKMRQWRDHGQQEKYVHISADGWNGRLDTLQCAILALKLTKLDEWNGRRRQAAQWYRDYLADDERITLPIEPNGRQHVYHLYVVRLPNREKVRQALSEQGIGVGLHYPIPLHLQPAYAHWGGQAGDFPASEAAANTILSLPMHPALTQEQVAFVCQRLKAAL